MSNERQPISRDDVTQAGQKAKDYAQEHPDQARSVIDKIEDAIDARTGGKFSGVIDKAGDFLEGKLGLPNNAGSQTSQPADPAEPTQSEPTQAEPTQAGNTQTGNTQTGQG